MNLIIIYLSINKIIKNMKSKKKKKMTLAKAIISNYIL